MQRKLHISRYNKTRNWAVWANEELLAVTVYRKGAQAVLDYIHNIIITNPTTQHTTMAKTKSVNTAAATITAADFDSTIIKAVNGEGKTIRIKLAPQNERLSLEFSKLAGLALYHEMPVDEKTLSLALNYVNRRHKKN